MLCIGDVLNLMNVKCITLSERTHFSLIMLFFPPYYLDSVDCVGNWAMLPTYYLEVGYASRVLFVSHTPLPDSGGHQVAGTGIGLEQTGLLLCGMGWYKQYIRDQTPESHQLHSSCDLWSPKNWSCDPVAPNAELVDCAEQVGPQRCMFHVQGRTWYGARNTVKLLYQSEREESERHETVKWFPSPSPQDKACPQVTHL